MSELEWRDHRRSDGLRVAKMPNGNWRIQAGPERGLSWETCPCCGKTLATADIAQRLADFMYPIPGPRERS